MGYTLNSPAQTRKKKVLKPIRPLSQIPSLSSSPRNIHTPQSLRSSHPIPQLTTATSPHLQQKPHNLLHIPKSPQSSSTQDLVQEQPTLVLLSPLPLPPPLLLPMLLLLSSSSSSFSSAPQEDPSLILVAPAVAGRRKRKFSRDMEGKM